MPEVTKKIDLTPETVTETHPWTKTGTLKRKTSSKYTWRLYFDFMPELAVWVSRESLTPEQDDEFYSLGPGSELTVRFFWQTLNAGRYQHYVLTGYRIHSVKEEPVPEPLSLLGFFKHLILSTSHTKRK